LAGFQGAGARLLSGAVSGRSPESCAPAGSPTTSASCRTPWRASKTTSRLTSRTCASRSATGALRTNLLERLFLEERRRLKIIPNAFGEKAVLKLMYGAMIRAAERWRGLPVTDFERRQLDAIKAELEAQYQASIDRPRRPPAQRFQHSQP